MNQSGFTNEKEEKRNGPASSLPPVSQKIFNKTFFRFLFSFVAVVAGVLLFILVLSAGGGVQ